MRRLKRSRKFFNTFSMILITMLVFCIGLTADAYADKAKELDSRADETLKRFDTHVKDAKEVTRRAKGLLVFPSVKKGAFIVGGEYGRGVMRIGGKTVDYYSMISGSVGFQIGGQAKDMIIAFMSDDALKNSVTARVGKLVWTET